MRKLMKREGTIELFASTVARSLQTGKKRLQKNIGTNPRGFVPSRFRKAIKSIAISACRANHVGRKDHQ
jgi:hypothetical protein